MIEEKYTIPVWCDVVRRPAIEVNCTDYRFPDQYTFVNELNKLFKGHVEFQNCVADIKHEKELKCKMCGNYCEVLLDDISKERTCNICGQGKLEYTIKFMEESEKKNE